MTDQQQMTVAPGPGRCPGCGYEWTHPDVIWRPHPSSLVNPCNCKSHVTPEVNEQQQHLRGNHNYRAWTNADAARQVARMENALARTRY